jgi:mannose-1-phosphate guanylyltransferase
MSRRERPKQLIDLKGTGSMIALTCERLLGIAAPGEILVVTVAEQREAIERALAAKIPLENVFCEPVGRNTAASVGLAAVLVERRFGDAPFLVVPADQLIGDGEAFASAARTAEAYAANRDCLLTFGIPPSRPETGYGYIRTGRAAPGSGGAPIFEAESFHEKPPLETALSYVASGDYLWNSGMFVWRPSVIRSAIAEHLPELGETLRKIEERLGTEPADPVLKSLYPEAPAVSIDYGVMEKAKGVVVLRGDFDWNDVGSWESLRAVFPEDPDGNVFVGEHVAVDSTGNTVFSPGRLVGLVGMKDVVVVDGGDAILVCARKDVQKVRHIVEALRKSGKEHLV